ncbi:MAG: DUF6686 family protein [Mucilaginibacter sp.]|uniref:DUF6686 family protein n=1 Tax=Mucilaginibacter sp. TaxID=1882438 RepID=UPI003266DA26
MCDAKVLSHKGAAVVSRCHDCRGLFIWNNNLVLNFTPTQFAKFRVFTQDLDIDEYTLPFPDGLDRVVMRTPNSDINLTFTPQEWHDFNEAIEEATHMLNVYELMEGE